MAKKKKWYVVWEGQNPGIYATWAECERQIKGYSGARYKSFKTRAEAQEAFAGESMDFIGQDKKKPKPAAQRSFDEGEGPLLPSICVDAACSGNPGVMEYRGVDTETGEEIFHEGPFSYGTNNIGEFLALVDGLRWLQEREATGPIYTDSRTALAWVRNKKVKTTLERFSANEELFVRMDEAVAWLKENTYANKLIKWPTETWGEIPADFGRK